MISMRRAVFSKKIMIAGVFAAGIVAVNVLGGGARDVLVSAVSGVQSAAWKGGSGLFSFVSGVARGPFLQKELDQARGEQRKLQQRVLVLESTEKENARLKEALEGFADDAREDLALASVIGKSASNDILFLDAGKNKGAKEGFPVITEARVAAGIIAEARDHTSEMRLISSDTSVFDAKIKSKEIVGVFKGAGGGMGLFDLVPREAGLSVGDVVSTASLGGVFPEDFLIGEVIEVKKSDLSAFQQASVRLFFDFKKEYSLFILKNE